MRTKIFSASRAAVTDHLTRRSASRLTAAMKLRSNAGENRSDVRCARRIDGDGVRTVNVGAGVKVIECGGAIRIEEATAAEGAVNVSGDVILSALCLSADGTYFRATAKATFHESIPVPDAAAGDSARAWGRCASVMVNAEEGGTLPWEIEYDLEAETIRPTTAKYTADVYSTA